MIGTQLILSQERPRASILGKNISFTKPTRKRRKQTRLLPLNNTATLDTSWKQTKIKLLHEESIKTFSLKFDVNLRYRY